MFVKKLQERNQSLIDQIVHLHQLGKIEPDSYVIDVDHFVKNAQMIKSVADQKNIRLYFMLKQVGRNPYLAKKLVELGYCGAVVVDFREAKVMMKHNIPLGNVGHLVQTPKAMLKSIMAYGTEVMTVYSYEKLCEINAVAKDLNINQNVLIKVKDHGDMQYSGQESGIYLSDLSNFIEHTKQLNNITLVGATSFPCFLYDCEKNDIVETPNYTTVLKATDLLKKAGCPVSQINLPSASCCLMLEKCPSVEMMTAEPGHGLSGTTPAHAYLDLEEVPCVAYVSEVSHCVDDASYCYGGGHYRRSNVKNALVLVDNQLVDCTVTPVSPESIDYYFQLNTKLPISATVIMAFRFQMFVTRSNVVLNQLQYHLNELVFW